MSWIDEGPDFERGGPMWLTEAEVIELLSQEDHWITARGEHVMLTEMGDRHLRNTIALLGNWNPLARVSPRALGPAPRGEQAYYEYERAVDDLARWASDVSTTPPFKAMVAEFDRRAVLT